MKISNAGVLEIAEHEGIVPGPYLDSRGVWTVGVGHTAAAGGPDPQRLPRGMPVDVDAAILEYLRLFDADLDKYEARVSAAIGKPLKQYQFDALVSFDLNTGGINRAKLTEAINRGDMSGDGFMGWLKPPEVIKRRQEEQALFRTGNYAANGDRIAVWRVDDAGNLRGILKTISGAELRALMAAAGSDRKPKPASPWAGLLAALTAAFSQLFGRKA